MRIVLGVLAGCALVGCARGTGGPGGSGDDDGSGGGDDAGVTATLSIAPPASELVILNGVAAHATYTATLSLSDGTTRDVTADTQFGIDGTYGGFAANELTISMAARTQVIGVYKDKMARADVVARIKSVRIEPPLPPDIAGLFEGPDTPASAPQIKYPPADTVMPRNLGDFEIHWTDANGNDAFEVSLHTDLSDVRVYFQGGNGVPPPPPLPPGPPRSWVAFQAGEWLAAVGLANAVTYQVRGVNTASPGVVGAMPPRTVQLSNETMDGGLYYWAAASTTNVTGIFRHDMTRPGLPPEEFLTTNQTGGRCIACHVLSRDGTKMAVTYDNIDTGPGTMVDVVSRKPDPETAQWNFGTFTPDNSQFLSVEHGILVVRDTTTRAVLAQMTTTPLNAWVTQPDLSPVGTQLVYVRPFLSGTDVDFKLGRLYVRSYDPATHTFGAERLLVDDGVNNFFPAWSPDGNWIAFSRSPSGDRSYDDNNTSAWVIKADGSQPAIELAKTNEGPGLTNSAVRWAPFPQTLGAAKEPMFWLTLPSKRDFGVRLTNTSLAQRAKTAQLWMTPFFPARAVLGQDPSVPAFRLPFQDLASSNHTAQWTQRVVVLQ
jgi:hypothetical protein